MFILFFQKNLGRGERKKKSGERRNKNRGERKEKKKQKRKEKIIRLMTWLT
jgi:hypothetical protein